MLRVLAVGRTPLGFGFAEGSFARQTATDSEYTRTLFTVTKRNLNKDAADTMSLGKEFAGLK